MVSDELIATLHYLLVFSLTRTSTDTDTNTDTDTLEGEDAITRHWNDRQRRGQQIEKKYLNGRAQPIDQLKFATSRVMQRLICCIRGMICLLLANEKAESLMELGKNLLSIGLNHVLISHLKLADADSFLEVE